MVKYFSKHTRHTQRVLTLLTTHTQRCIVDSSKTHRQVSCRSPVGQRGVGWGGVGWGGADGEFDAPLLAHAGAREGGLREERGRLHPCSCTMQGCMSAHGSLDDPQASALHVLLGVAVVVRHHEAVVRAVDADDPPGVVAATVGLVGASW